MGEMFYHLPPASGKPLFLPHLERWRSWMDRGRSDDVLTTFAHMTQGQSDRQTDGRRETREEILAVHLSEA